MSKHATRILRLRNGERYDDDDDVRQGGEVEARTFWGLSSSQSRIDDLPNPAAHMVRPRVLPGGDTI